MSATLTRLVFAPDGTLQQIVSLDDDAQLKNYRTPAGSVFADIPRDQYRANVTDRDNFALAQTIAAKTDPQIAAVIMQGIAKIDAAVLSGELGLGLT